MPIITNKNTELKSHQYIPIYISWYADVWILNIILYISVQCHLCCSKYVTFYFRWSYYLGGGLEPAYFHVPNILLHGLVSVLLLRMFSLLFGGYSVSIETGALEFKAARSSLLCATLFAVHPIHTESVSC